jgi:hypothetical protein
VVANGIHLVVGIPPAGNCWRSLVAFDPPDHFEGLPTGDTSSIFDATGLVQAPLARSAAHSVLSVATGPYG